MEENVPDCSSVWKGWKKRQRLLRATKDMEYTQDILKPKGTEVKQKAHNIPNKLV